MNSNNDTDRLLTARDARGFFQQSINAAMTRQHVRASDHTVGYVVNMLASFVRTDALFEPGQEGPLPGPLAMLYGRAVSSSSDRARNAALRRLGDVALFIAGLFPDSLRRKPVDVDYYVAMGGSAYDYLSRSWRDPQDTTAGRSVFKELAASFQDFTDVLAEMAAEGALASHRDLLRTYELWSGTGSRRAAAILRRAGIEPLPGSGSHH